MPRPEREDGVQRGNVAPSRREVEEIGIAVRGQVARRGTRELFLQEAHMCAQPAWFPATNDTSRQTSVGPREEMEEVRCDEPAIGPGTIAFASEPEEHTVQDNGGEEEHLIFEDFVVYN